MDEKAELELPPLGKGFGGSVFPLWFSGGLHGPLTGPTDNYGGKNNGGCQNVETTADGTIVEQHDTGSPDHVGCSGVGLPDTTPNCSLEPVG